MQFSLRSAFFTLASIAALQIPSVFASQTATPPGLSLPDAQLEPNLGPQFNGRLNGHASVNASGYASIQIPIPVPTPTGGFAPNLNLSYSSSGANGLLGVGWSISGLDDSIYRCPKNMAQDQLIRAVEYTANDRFCLNGQKLMLVSGVYGQDGAEYHTENNRFSKIVSKGNQGSGPEYFEVHTKSGLTKTYGTNSSTGIVDLATTRRYGSQEIYRWSIAKVMDRSSNFYRYSYNPGQELLHIYYSGNDAAPQKFPIDRVDFIYESRQDSQERYTSGAQDRRLNRRLKAIRTKASEFRMSYEYTEYSKSTRLVSVKECSRSSGQCKTPTTLEWQSQGGVAYSKSQLTVPLEAVDQTCEKVRYDNSWHYPRWHDFNNDGKADYLSIRRQYPIYGHTSNFQALYADILLSNDSDGYDPVTWQIPFLALPERIRFVDINGDKRVDLVYVVVDKVNRNVKVNVALSTAAGFISKVWHGHTQQDTSWLLGSTSYPVSLDDFDLVDVDGDLLPDLLVKEKAKLRVWDGSRHYYESLSNVFVHRNTGSSFNSEELWAERVRGSLKLQDLNRDRLPDLVYKDGGFLLNSNSGFDINGYKPYLPGKPVRYEDVNNDGYPDLLYEDVDALGNNVTKVLQNTGNDFTSYAATLNQYHQFGQMDVNGDGYKDTSNTKYDAYIGRSSTSLSLKATDGTQSQSFQFIRSERGQRKSEQYVDINGDGLLDYTHAKVQACTNPRTGPGYYNYFWAETNKHGLFLSDSVPAHLLAAVHYGLGNSVGFEYESIRDPSVYTKGEAALFPEQDVQSSRYVVTKVSRSNGLGSFDSLYSYEGLKANLIGRGDLGFEKIIVENQTSGITTETTYAQAFPIISRPTLIEKFHTASNTKIHRQSYSYATKGVVGSGPVFPYVASATRQSYDPEDGRLLSTSMSTNTVDDYGNVTLTRTDIHDHESGTSYNREQQRQFTIDTNTWQLAKLNQAKVRFGLNGSFDAALERTTQYEYYSNGALHRSIREPGAGAPLELTTELSYTRFGLPTQTTVTGPGITSRSSHTYYDQNGRFATSAVNPVGHSASAAYDVTRGLPISETDINGLTTTHSYNAIGQRTLTTLPDGNTIEYSVRLDNSGGNNGAKYYVEVVPDGKPAVRTFYDGLGRQVRTRSQSFDGRYVNQDTQYDSKGRAYRVSEPFFDGDTPVWNRTYFDSYGRIDSVDAIDNTADSQFDYDGFSTGLTDALGRRSSVVSSATGMLLNSVDKAGTSTSFSYNAAGQRTQVRNAVGLIKEFSVHYQYDRLGRLTQQDDPSHGIYTYEYDALGQKVKEVSPKMWAANQSVQYRYDLLGRMTQRIEPEGTTTWEYDNTDNGNMGLGRLHRESMTGFSREYEYAAGQYGRPTAVETQILDASYREVMSYDNFGNLEALQYPSTASSPSGWQAHYQYNDLGYLEQVTDGANEVYYQLVNTDASGRLTEQWMGDGSLLEQQYKPHSSRLSSQKTNKADGALLQHFTYQYDAAGNMTQRQDVARSLVEDFTYDNLDRLTRAQVVGQNKVDYAFDEVDNITEKSDIGLYGYSTATANAVIDTELAGIKSNYSYDDNGNFFAGDNMPNATWSSYNKPLSLNKDGHNYEFNYGPNRARYRQRHTVAGSERITHYVGGNYEVIYNGANTEYRHLLRANGRVVMMRREKTGPSGNSIEHEYLHRDHLGSITAISKESDGSLLGAISYDAWGKRRSADDWAASYQASAALDGFERGYTGHEHLSGVDIIHMNGRVYSAELGKMMSPDPVTAEPDNGRNYNRYTYAFNNPLKFTDPTGYSVEPAPGATCPRDGPPVCPPSSQASLNDWNRGVGALTPDEEDHYDGWSTGDYQDDAPQKETKEENKLKPTEEEKKLIEQGKLGEMWKQRCKNGDPIGCVGWATWGKPSEILQYFGLLVGGKWLAVGLTVRTNAEKGLLFADPSLLFDADRLERKKLEFGKAIAYAHLNATGRDKDGRPYSLTPEEITQYHHEVFDDFNVPRGFYGGSYVLGVHDEYLAPHVYCSPSCDSEESHKDESYDRF
ncbi:SpvB/TcaC N-terminal domain-containing protein [uncultured Pseudoteredinibacter sp.]|uniref:SpvB/TcaC N-terminal domain-containing protein n=1 Tax=uncultured Pseudoteredinibacter sp. TaxID=1641701 RepID=UPI00261A8C35|nr:SpvB/TcaC N-terminal domain-containing protein [uncultured Pseudoteredinibacter sp.]